VLNRNNIAGWARHVRAVAIAKFTMLVAAPSIVPLVHVGD
jgi:hypothetical protein